MIIRIRSKDGRKADKDMGPMAPHVKSRGGVPLSMAQAIVTPGGIDWRQSKKRRKKTA